MPLVFVHGIGNRRDDGYQDRSASRNRLFETFLLPVIGARPGVDKIWSPLWGDVGANLRWHGSSLPSAGLEALGGDDGDDLAAEVIATEVVGDPDRVLCGIARRDLADVVDLLFSLPPDDDRWDASVTDAAGRMVAYCRYRERLSPQPDQFARYPWLKAVRDDDELLDVLWNESRGWVLDDELRPARATTVSDGQTLGGFAATHDWLARGLRRLRRIGVGAPAAGAAVAMRAVTANKVTRLVGDVLTYLGQRGSVTRPDRS